jgi:hypothetical protein
MPEPIMINRSEQGLVVSGGKPGQNVTVELRGRCCPFAAESGTPCASWCPHFRYDQETRHDMPVPKGHMWVTITCTPTMKEFAIKPENITTV